MLWLLVVLLVLVGAEHIQAQWSGDPCEALRLRLKVEGARGGSFREGETAGVTLKGKNVGKAPLTGLGIKLALSNVSDPQGHQGVSASAQAQAPGDHRAGPDRGRA